MKTFKDYFVESRKTYSFRISVAGDIPEKFEDRLKTAMEKYSVVSISKGPTVPITETPYEFPNLQNMEVTHYAVEVKYPTVDSILEEYLGSVCGVHRSHVRVVNKNKTELENPIDTPGLYEPLLTQPDMGGESAQEWVGNNRVTGLLKELEASRNQQGDNEHKFTVEITDQPSNKTSVIGNKK